MRRGGLRGDQLQLGLDQSHQLTDVFDFLDLRNLELDVEVAFGFDDQRDVGQRVPARYIVAGGLKSQFERWILENRTGNGDDFRQYGAVRRFGWHDLQPPVAGG